MKHLPAVLLTCLLAASGPTPAPAHDGHSLYDNRRAVWILFRLDGERFPARATLTFPETGRIAGQAPCNRWFAEMWSPYPWFQPGAIGATRMACPDLAHEKQFLGILQQVTLADQDGDMLLLSTDDGHVMEFSRAGF